MCAGLREKEKGMNLEEVLGEEKDGLSLSLYVVMFICSAAGYVILVCQRVVIARRLHSSCVTYVFFFRQCSLVSGFGAGSR
jgi:hypothetical protein